jgi:hypothetical protein
MLKDQIILDARKAGLDALSKNPSYVRSVVVQIDNEMLTVFPNGDVDASDGYRYSIALIAKNALVQVGA